MLRNGVKREGNATNMSIGHDAHRRVSVFTVIEKKERRAREREAETARQREREREFYVIEPCTGVIY